MGSPPIQLHSERHGRPRKLSVDDLALLVWRKIFRARDFHWLFKGTLQPYRGLGPEEEKPTIADAEAFFMGRLKVSGIGHSALKADEPPISVFEPVDLDLLLDLVELLHAEVVAEPIMVHPPDCLDIEGFDKEAGQKLFRDEINEAFRLTSPPLELLPIGHIVERDDEHRELYVEPVPPTTEAEVKDPVEHAVGLFLRRGATVEDQRAAVKQLADALEHLRSEVKLEMLSKDERDLFQIANGFAIRHSNAEQRREYDKPAWLSWMFHVFLATIRVVVAVRDR